MEAVKTSQQPPSSPWTTAMTGHLHFSIALMESCMQKGVITANLHRNWDKCQCCMQRCMRTWYAEEMHVGHLVLLYSTAGDAGHTCHFRMCLLRASRALPGHGMLIMSVMLLSADKSIPAQKFFPCPCSRTCTIVRGQLAA